jgi:hypothetical protein
LHSPYLLAPSSLLVYSILPSFSFLILTLSPFSSVFSASSSSHRSRIFSSLSSSTFSHLTPLFSLLRSPPQGFPGWVSLLQVCVRYPTVRIRKRKKRKRGKGKGRARNEHSKSGKERIAVALIAIVMTTITTQKTKKKTEKKKTYRI